MYTDLADAVEDLKEKGIESLKFDDEMKKKIRSKQIDEQIREIKILETHRFDTNRTNPEDESTLYLLEFPDKSRKYLILSFGIYEDPDKSDFIDELLKMEQR